MIDPMSTASRRLILGGYAALAYAAFLAAALWTAGFLAGTAVPVTIDSGSRPPAAVALAADTGLLLLFAGQHTVMARRGFKRRLARVMPAEAERSTFVLASGLALLLLCWQWQPLPAQVWLLRGWWTPLAWAVYGAGWLIAVGATFMVDHLDFLGLRQAGYGRQAAAPPVLRERWLYRWVRHPMMTGLLVTFWATPRMTAGHLLFAAAGTAYIAVGIRFEERELRGQFGERYREYARRVPALIPLPRRPVPGRRRAGEAVRSDS